MGYDETEMGLQMEEHEAWKAWCEEFNRATDSDINYPRFRCLAELVEQWGYALMKLRNYQSGLPQNAGRDMRSHKEVGLFRK